MFGMDEESTSFCIQRYFDSTLFVFRIIPLSIMYAEICDNSLNFLLQIALAEVSRIKSKGKNISLFYGNSSDCFVMGAPNKQEANRVGEFLSTAADECFNRSSPQKSMSLSVPFYMDDVSNPSPRLSMSDFPP